ncbi:Uncharacterised protein [Enterobacter cloacae]|nr:Uncharacterised protein [Enterobacter cloacae]
MVDVIWRDADQVEDCRTVNRQYAGLITQDGAPGFPWFFFLRHDFFGTS